MVPRSASWLLLLAALAGSGCPKDSAPGVELQRFPLDDLSEILVRPTTASIDKAASADGKGSLKVEAKEPMAFVAFDLGPLPDCVGAPIIFRAQVRTDGFTPGNVFPAILARKGAVTETFEGVPGVRGPRDRWSMVEATMPARGSPVDDVRLQFNMNGRGTAWFDDARVYKGSASKK